MNVSLQNYLAFSTIIYKWDGFRTRVSSESCM